MTWILILGMAGISGAVFIYAWSRHWYGIFFASLSVVHALLFAAQPSSIRQFRGWFVTTAFAFIMAYWGQHVPDQFNRRR